MASENALARLLVYRGGVTPGRFAFTGAGVAAAVMVGGSGRAAALGFALGVVRETFAECVTDVETRYGALVVDEAQDFDEEWWTPGFF